MDLSAKYRLGMWGIAVLVVLNIGLMGVLWYEHFADQPERPQPGGQPNPGQFFIRELGLSGMQADSLLVLLKQHRDEVDPVRARILHLNRQMIEDLFAASPDTSRIRALSDSIGEGQAEFERSVLAHFGRIKQMCNPEQKARLHQLLLETLERTKLPPPPPGRGNDRRPPAGDRPPPPDAQGPRPGDRPPPPGEGN